LNRELGDSSIVIHETEEERPLTTIVGIWSVKIGKFRLIDGHTHRVEEELKASVKITAVEHDSFFV
jgi:hypothetical protein